MSTNIKVAHYTEVRCIEECGFYGGRSGETCPECSGFLLSRQEIEEADRIAEEVMQEMNY